jgi:ABC-type phosphate transport system auxiliary subunit
MLYPIDALEDVEIKCVPPLPEVMGQRASTPAASQAAIQGCTDAAEADALQEERAALQEERAALQEERAALQDHVDAAVVDALHKERAAHQAQLATLQTQLATLQTQLATIHTQLVAEIAKRERAEALLIIWRSM